MSGNGRRLSGKVAVITGATGGIGEATAKLFLDEGASVMLVGRSAERLKATRERLAVENNLADLPVLPFYMRNRCFNNGDAIFLKKCALFCWNLAFAAGT